MLNYKIIATDLDGTLLDDKHLLSPENEQSIIDVISSDHYFVMNSGALPKDARKILELTKIGVSEKTKWFVGVNGAVIYNFLTDETFINVTNRQNVVNTLNKDKSVNYSIVEINNQKYLRLVIKNKDTWYNTLITVYNDLQDSNKLQGFKDLINIMNKYDHLNLSLNDIIYFGDNLNDIPVFENPDIKCIAVKNAIDQIQKLADEITDSNVDKGFSTYINKNK